MKSRRPNSTLGSKKSSYLTLLRGLALFSLLLPSASLKAAKLDWSGGTFDLISKTPTTSSHLNNPFGSFQISHRIELIEQVEFAYGYSMTFSKFFSGDYGYGPDLGLFYFPLTSAGATKLNEKQIRFFRSELLRPFVCVHFHSRQFQSIGASYAGLSTGGGLEFWNFHPLGLRLWGKQAQLRGPQRSTASELTLYGGISWEY